MDNERTSEQYGEVTIYYRNGVPVAAETKTRHDIGLWFEGKTLTDYDGCFELPKAIGEVLEQLGYTVTA